MANSARAREERQLFYVTIVTDKTGYFCRLPPIAENKR